MKYFLLFVSFWMSLFSQSTSIHKLHKEEFGLKFKSESFFNPSGIDIVPLKKSSALKKTVFGYLPDWEYVDGRKNLKYDLLSHIAAFDFSVDKNGNVSNPSYWPWTDVLNTAHQNGVKVILCAVNFTQSELTNIIRNDSIKQNLFLQLKNKLAQYKLDGVNIDFEDLKTADRGVIFNSFMSDLTKYLKNVNPDYEISFAGPAVNWGGWDFLNLAKSLDYIFIMGYNFYGSWSTTSGACAPYLGGSYNISNTVNTQYGFLPDSLRQKCILGLPYYGFKWITKTQNPHSPVISFVSTTRYRTDFSLANQFGVQWSTDNQVPWYRWQISDTSWGQVWFDNDSSLDLKFALADAKNFKGVGMWALNYDGALPQLWNVIRKRYFVMSVNEFADGSILKNFKLEQNYPNPFNGSTKINYQIFKSGIATLKIFDLLGNENIIFSKHHTMGNYFYNLNFSNFTSGMYFYKLELNASNKKQTETKKLIFIK